VGQRLERAKSPPSLRCRGRRFVRRCMPAGPPLDCFFRLRFDGFSRCEVGKPGGADQGVEVTNLLAGEIPRATRCFGNQLLIDEQEPPFDQFSGAASTGSRG